jgi:hypothetical protein
VEGDVTGANLTKSKNYVVAKSGINGAPKHEHHGAAKSNASHSNYVTTFIHHLVRKNGPSTNSPCMGSPTSNGLLIGNKYQQQLCATRTYRKVPLADAFHQLSGPAT